VERDATGTSDPDLIAGKPRLGRVARELAVLAVRGDEVLEVVTDTQFFCPLGSGTVSDDIADSIHAGLGAPPSASAAKRPS
jgi:hypothetical protein